MRGALERLQQLDTCAISDALDMLGVAGATTGLNPMWSVDTVVVGRVRTVQAGPKSSGGPAAHIAAAAIEAAGPDDVLVIANGGRRDVSCWGGILTAAASSRGIRGVVIDGACRDVAQSEALRFPVFALAAVPVSARGRIVQLSMGEPVEAAGVLVREEDFVVGDRNGVVVIRAEHAESVLKLAERITEREANMVAAVQEGGSVTTVMYDTAFPTLEE